MVRQSRVFEPVQQHLLVRIQVHPFHVLRKNAWDSVWQLDQFPFREDCVEAATMAIDFLKRVDRGLGRLDLKALRAAQERQDAMAALKLAQEALFGGE